MTETTTTLVKKHNTYGGEIELEDFNTNIPNKKRIINQIDADNLPLLLKKKKDKREEEKMYKSMTLEELREMKLVSNTNQRPLPTLTNEKWQKEFELRKLFIKKYDKSINRFGKKYSREFGSSLMDDEQKTYSGCTNWQQYCSYINDVLNNIKKGQVEFCYFIYQIMDLYKFDFGKRELKTKYYCEGYWEIWLANK